MPLILDAITTKDSKSTFLCFILLMKWTYFTVKKIIRENIYYLYLQIITFKDLIKSLGFRQIKISEKWNVL